ncbi:hypothetical protein D3C84_1141610 [compost metagenome]
MVNCIEASNCSRVSCGPRSSLGGYKAQVMADSIAVMAGSVWLLAGRKVKGAVMGLTFTGIQAS